jgi:hypothetical protein
MPQKLVLIVSAPSKGYADMLEGAMRCAGQVRAAGNIPLARCLDRQFQFGNFAELNRFDRYMIMGKCVDSVIFIDAADPEVSETVKLAQQFHYATQVVSACEA